MGYHPDNDKSIDTDSASDDENACPVIVSVRFRPLNDEEQEEASKKIKAQAKKKATKPKKEGEEKDPEEQSEEDLIKDASKGWDIEKIQDTDIVVEKNVKRKTEGKNMFTFDSIYDDNASVDWVYYGVVRPVLLSVLSGKHGTVFTYGQTGSGKTYTMHGDLEIGGEEGVIQMAIRELFTHIETELPNREYTVHGSYFEIYNEQVRDLLGGTSGVDKVSPAEGEDKTAELPVLSVREDPKSGDVYVNSQFWEVTSMEDVVRMLQKGSKNRAFACTSMNRNSSRSHAVFRLKIKSQEKLNGGVGGQDGPVRVLSSVFNFVDLAGSESAARSGTSGKKSREGGKINQSLLSLSQVVSALSLPPKKKPKFINYRDSKLTRILQPHLSGNANLAMICCASLSKNYMEETRSTLKFAAGAKVIKMKPTVNEVIDDKAVLSKLQKELEQTRNALNLAGAGGATPQQPPSKPQTSRLASQSTMSNDSYFDANELDSGVFEDDDQQSTSQYRSTRELPPPPRQDNMFLDTEEPDDEHAGVIYTEDGPEEVYDDLKFPLPPRPDNNKQSFQTPPRQSPLKEKKTQLVLTPDGNFETMSMESEGDGYSHIFGSDSGQFEEEASQEMEASYSHIFGDDPGTFEDSRIQNEEIYSPAPGSILQSSGVIRNEDVFQPNTDVLQDKSSARASSRSTSTRESETSFSNQEEIGDSNLTLDKQLSEKTKAIAMKKAANNESAMRSELSALAQVSEIHPVGSDETDASFNTPVLDDSRETSGRQTSNFLTPDSVHSDQMPISGSKDQVRQKEAQYSGGAQQHHGGGGTHPDDLRDGKEEIRRDQEGNRQHQEQLRYEEGAHPSELSHRMDLQQGQNILEEDVPDSDRKWFERQQSHRLQSSSSHTMDLGDPSQSGGPIDNPWKVEPKTAQQPPNDIAPYHQGRAGGSRADTTLDHSFQSCEESDEMGSVEKFENEIEVDEELDDKPDAAKQQRVDTTLATDQMLTPDKQSNAHGPSVVVIHPSKRGLGLTDQSETSDLSVEAADGAAIHPKTSKAIISSIPSYEKNPSGDVVVLLDSTTGHSGARNVSKELAVALERLQEAEKRAKFFETKLEQTEDLVESLFSELENARKFIRQLVSRMPTIESDLKDMEHLGGMLADELILRQFTLLKYAIYVSLGFYLAGHAELFLATVFFLWLTLEVATW